MAGYSGATTLRFTGRAIQRFAACENIREALVNILNRNLRATELPGKTFIFSLKVLRGLCLFQNSTSLIRHYLHRSSPANKCIRFRDGRQMKLSRHPLDVVVLFQIFCERVYRRNRNSRVVIDVGAHIGSFASYMAFHGAKKVFAFEPNGEAHACLLDNIETNNLGNTIIPFRLAVTGRANETVRIPVAASPQNRILSATVENGGEQKYESVKTISLNDIVVRESLACIDLLKLDCEGSEYDIIAATDKATFANIRNVVVEYHDDRVEEIVDRLRSHGFYVVNQKPETEKMGMLWLESHHP